MSATSSLRAALAGSSAAVLLAVLPAMAGSSTGSNQTTFGVSETANAQHGTTGSTLSETTGLSFSTNTSTPLDSLTFGGGVGLVLTRNPDGSTSNQVTTPNLSLGYAHTTASAALNANLAYSLIQLQTYRPLSDFINAQGLLVLPTNPDQLLGTGLEKTENAGVSLEFGRNGPWGVTLNGGYNKTTYPQASAADLQNTTSASLGLTGRYDYSPVGTLTFGVTQAHNTTQGASSQDITTFSLSTAYKVSPVLSVSGGGIYKITDDSVSGRSSAASPQVGVDYTLQNGSIIFNATNDSASLSWQQKTAQGNLSATASHGPGGTNGTGTQNAFGLSYTQSINAVSSLDLGVYYSDLTSPGADISGTSFSVSYTHQLTVDWGLSAGVSYQMRNEVGSGRTNTTGLFVTLSRNFSFLH